MHLDTLDPVATPIVDTPHGIGVCVRQRPLDCIRIPFPGLIEKRRRRRSPTMGRHLIGSVSHPPKGLIDRILAHWASGSVEGWKHKPRGPGQLPHVAKVGKNLLRERDRVGPTRFHPSHRDRPFGLIEVELIPLCKPKFARSAHDMWHDLHRDPRDRIAGVLVD